MTTVGMILKFHRIHNDSILFELFLFTFRSWIVIVTQASALRCVEMDSFNGFGRLPKIFGEFTFALRLRDGHENFKEKFAENW